MTPHGDAASFLIAGYGLTWVALVVYAWRVERRLSDARKAVDALDDSEEEQRS